MKWLTILPILLAQCLACDGFIAGVPSQNTVATTQQTCSHQRSTCTSTSSSALFAKRTLAETAPAPVNLQSAFNKEVELVQADWPLYLYLAAIQFLPLISLSREADLFYFASMACVSVYLGAKRQDVPSLRQAISPKQAGLAPVFSSITIVSLYLLLKVCAIINYFSFTMSSIISS
jgi:hypothetical protein